MKSRFLCALALLLCFSGDLYPRPSNIMDMVERGWEDLQDELANHPKCKLLGIVWAQDGGGGLSIGYSLGWSEDLSPEQAAEVGQKLGAILHKTVASEKERKRIFKTDDVLACFDLTLRFPSSIGLDGKHERSQMDLSKADMVAIDKGILRVRAWDPETGYPKTVTCEPLKAGQEEAPDEE